MDAAIADKFERMGARLKVGASRHHDRSPVRIDIRRDSNGEYFDMRVRSGVDISVIDVRPKERHLLLMTREADTNSAKSKFLCGHDERHWFVAAIPESSHVRDVATAMDALKPDEVWAAIQRVGLAAHKRNSRDNAAFKRQGEWFFIPAQRLKVDPLRVLRNEPIRRGAGKPHWCEMLYRTGGVQVYVSSRYPNGLLDSEYRALPPHERESTAWRVMQRDAMVFVRGAIRHKDHATLRLDYWHRVVMNTETQAAAMRHVAFLD